MSPDTVTETGDVDAETLTKAAEPERPARRGRSSRIRNLALPIGLVVLVVVFGVARPDSFLTADNARNVLFSSAAPLVLALGLTVTLVMGDFDLSIGSMLGLGGATAVALMSLHQLQWSAAIGLALLVAVIAGLLNGVLVAVVGGSSFILTLGMGTILLGVEYLVDRQQTLFSGISTSYISLGQSRPFAGINTLVLIAAALAIVMFVVMEFTESGRFMYAIGGNAEAARLAGVAVRRYRMIGFVVAAVAAAVAGIMVTASNASSTPNAGVPYLLPAFAAAFLGTTTFRQGQFNIGGTVLGVLFLQVVSTGLTMLSLSTAVISITQGVFLVLAILSTRLGRGLVGAGR